MKKLFLFLSIAFSFAGMAQAPQGINNQGVARNNAGQAISNVPIGVQLRIHQGSPVGTVVFTEAHTVTTDTFGLYSLVIGSVSSLSTVNWSTGNFWLEVSIDPGGGSSYVSVANTQLMSVPFALYAQTAGSGGGGGNISGQANNIPRINNNGNGLGRSIISQSADSSSIGINNPSPASNAILDISSASKGVLFPRMLSSQRTGIGSPNHGLMVFQKDNQGIASPEGFWYYDSTVTQWLFMAPAQAVWTLSGNIVGNSGFIGSLDDKDVVFKTGLLTPTERMRVLSNTNGGNVQFGNSGNSTHYIFPAAKGNPGYVLQMDPANTNKVIWAQVNGSGTSFWQRTGGKLSPVTLSDTVGIGTSSPHAALDIYSMNNSGALNVVSTSSVTNAVTITSTDPNNGYAVVQIDASASATANALNAHSDAGYALSGVANDAPSLWVRNTSPNYATIEAENQGGHSAAYFHNNSTNSNAPTMFVGTTDPNQYTAQFNGGLGVNTDNIRITGAGGPVTGYVLTATNSSGDAKWTAPGGGLPPAGNAHILFDSLGFWKPSYPGNLYFDGKKMGIGNASPNALLAVVNSGTTVVNAVDVTNTGSGNAGRFFIINPNNDSTALIGYTNGKSNAILGISEGSGNAGAFGVNNSSSLGNGLIASTNGGGKAVFGINSGTGYSGAFYINNSLNDSSAVLGATNGSGAGVTGYNIGSGMAGFFQVNNPSSTSNAFSVMTNAKGGGAFFQIQNNTNSNPAVYATTDGSGYAIEAYIPSSASATGIAAFGNGSGHSIIASATGAADAINASASGGGHAVTANSSSPTGNAVLATSNGNPFTIASTNTGTTGGAGNFQVQNNTNSSAALLAQTSGGGPALRAVGSGAANSHAAVFTGGAVAVGTVSATSGLDVKSSLGVSVKKYTTAGNINILISDPNVVHMAMTSGTFTFNLPDATLCPGRILIFTSDNSVTGGTTQLMGFSGQQINGSSNFSFNFTTGSTKPSYGIISDGANWQIIFKN